MTKEKPIDLIGQYVELRDQLKAADAAYAAWKKEQYDDTLDAIELKLLDQMNQTGVDSFKTKKGTAYKKKSVSLTTADGSEFRRHVIGLEAWDLIEFRPAKTAVVELIDNGEPVPPGLNYTTRYNVNINRPSKENK
jgi:hypothetical protein